MGDKVADESLPPCSERSSDDETSSDDDASTARDASAGDSLFGGDVSRNGAAG